MAALSALHLPTEAASWQDAMLAAGSGDAWIRRVSDMTTSYVAFLRQGVACTTCGRRVPQPLMRRGAAHAADAFTQPAAAAATSSSGGGEMVIDLTEADESDPMAPPPEAQHNVLAPVAVCEACAARYCAACGHFHGHGAGGDGAAAAPAAVALPTATDDIVEIASDSNDESEEAPPPAKRARGGSRGRARGRGRGRAAARGRGRGRGRTAESDDDSDGDGGAYAEAAAALVADGSGEVAAAAPAAASAAPASEAAGALPASATASSWLPTGPDEIAHARTCQLRRVHGLAVAVERLRRVHLRLALEEGGPARAVAAPVAAPAPAPAPAAKSAARRKRGATAAAAAAAEPAPPLPSSAARASHAAISGKMLHEVKMAVSRIKGFGRGTNIATIAPLLHVLVPDIGKIGPEYCMSRESEARKQGRHAYEYDPDVDSDDDWGAVAANPAMYAGGGMGGSMWGMGIFGMVGYGGGGGSSSSSGSTMYGGGADDTAKARLAEVYTRLLQEHADGKMTHIFGEIEGALPRQIVAKNGWAPVETAITLLSPTDAGAGAGAAALGSPKPTTAAAAILHASPVELVTGVRTDGASDHPLLLSMLTLPGFGDGLTTDGRVVVDHIAVAEEEIAAESAAAAATTAAGRKRVARTGMTATAMAAKRKAAAARAAAEGPVPPKLGAGDGLHGGSITYIVMRDLLRSSIMEVSKSEQRRALFFKVITTVQALSKHPDLTAFLAFTPAAMEALNPAPTASDGGSGAAARPFTAWIFAPDVTPLSASPSLVLPPLSVGGMLLDLRKQADIFVRNSTNMSGASEVLVGDSADDQQFMSVLCLSRDLEVAADIAKAGLLSWFSRSTTIATALGIVAERAARVDSRSAAAAGTGVGAGVGAGAGAGSSSSSASSSAAASGSSGRSVAPKYISGVIPADELVALAKADALGRRPDPSVTYHCGFAPIAFTPSADDISSYEAVMREEAYATMDELQAQHHYKTAAASSAGSAPAGADMKRHLRLSAEMANLPSLAINFPSSVLVRQDEASMDFLRAMITGPSDTPYMNGVFLFDIFLPHTYPNTSPNVILLTTGGGKARFNPNLYADGKVCLSLLGTWSGPGWEPNISTLSQVLIAIQSQIMNDQPYFNEPGYESSAGTPSGKRNVSRHNLQIRLATIRFAMLDQLKKRPAGFERAVQAHFWYKRAEVRAQLQQWVADAKAMAAYEHALRASYDADRAMYTALLDAAILATPKYTPPQVGKKRNRYTYSNHYGGYDTMTGKSLPHGFAKSAELTVLEKQLQANPFTAFNNDRGFTVFGSGLAGLPMASTDSYAPGAKLTAAAPAAASSSMYAAAPTTTLVDLAAATEAAANEVLAELSKLTEPEPSAGDLY